MGVSQFDIDADAWCDLQREREVLEASAHLTDEQQQRLQAVYAELAVLDGK